MAERVWSEKDLARRANRRLAVLRHAEEVSRNVAATTASAATSSTGGNDATKMKGIEGLKEWEDYYSYARPHGSVGG